MTQLFIIGSTLAALAVLVALVAAFNRIRDLERDLENERKWHRDFRDEFREHYWDMHRAVAAMGLKKLPSKGPEWVKEQQ